MQRYAPVYFHRFLDSCKHVSPRILVDHILHNRNAINGRSSFTLCASTFITLNKDTSVTPRSTRRHDKYNSQDFTRPQSRRLCTPCPAPRCPYQPTYPDNTPRNPAHHSYTSLRHPGHSPRQVSLAHIDRHGSSSVVLCSVARIARSKTSKASRTEGTPYHLQLCEEQCKPMRWTVGKDRCRRCSRRYTVVLLTSR